MITHKADHSEFRGVIAILSLTNQSKIFTLIQKYLLNTISRERARSGEGGKRAKSHRSEPFLVEYIVV
jgi:hypothetical protein